MANRPRNLEELREVVRREAEIRIRGWAIDEASDPEELLARLKAAFGAFEHTIEEHAFERMTRDHLAQLRFILWSHLPGSPIEVPEGVLKLVPPSRPSVARWRLRQIAEAAWEHAAEALQADEGDDDDDAEDVDEGVTFRARVVSTFGAGLPGLKRRPGDGELAALSLWLAPSNGCDPRWSSDKRSWRAVYDAERRAFATARRREDQ